MQYKSITHQPPLIQEAVQSELAVVKKERVSLQHEVDQARGDAARAQRRAAHAESAQHAEVQELRRLHQLEIDEAQKQLDHMRKQWVRPQRFQSVDHYASTVLHRS